MDTSLLPILLIEDSDEDYIALRRAWQQTGLRNPLYRCADGDEALEYLRQTGRYADAQSAPCPALILLDLNLPGTDGREVITIIKRDENLCLIPIVVMTTSSNPRDVRDCYCCGANSYQVKAADYDLFKQQIKRLAEYWFDTVVLPAVADCEIKK